MYNEHDSLVEPLCYGDELHVRFGFIHVELSIRSMLMVDLLYTKRMTGKKRCVLAVSDLQASTR